MKILNISLDKKLFEKNSGVRKRVLEYAKIVERFDILVLSMRRYEKIEFENIAIWPTNSKHKFFYLKDAYKQGKEMIKKYGYDLISVQDPFEIGFIGWRLAKKHSLKFQVQLHGDFFGSPYWRKEKFSNWFRFYIGKYVIRRADGIRVVSQRIKRSLLEMGISEGKITVVPIYVEVAQPICHSRESGNPELKELDSVSRHGMTKAGKFIFLTVGRLEPVKNIAMQIKAMAGIAKNHPEVELWIVGDGREKEKLETLSSRLFGSAKNSHSLSFPRRRESREFNKNIDSSLRGNDNRGISGGSIKFFGWQNDLDKFYQQADVFLLTSNYEGWGMAVIEAASYGLPIIMTDVGLAGEVIRNNESGIVIPANDEKALVQAMNNLIENNNLRRKIGEGAREAVSKLSNKEESLRMHIRSLEILK